MENHKDFVCYWKYWMNLVDMLTNLVKEKEVYQFI
jgi:hypothetical protein